MRGIKFLSVLFLLFWGDQIKAQPTESIKLNQIGFYTNAAKIAIVTGHLSASIFYILSPDLRDTIYTGRLSEEKQSANSVTITRIADFSVFTKKGSYVVNVPGTGSSYVFAISDRIHQAVSIASLKGFYFQRVSMRLEKQYAGKWARPAGHPDTAVLVHPSAATVQRPAGTIISTPGGWYDAGDYNKYIVNSGISMGTLLSAYEDFAAYFDQLNTNIPESRDAIPDILNEVLYNLRWMLTMQDPNDGGVYNKCTNAAFDGMVMPGVTKLPRYVVQKGTAATLDFAAVTAQAARILKHFNKQLPGLRDSCLHAAQYAWQWALKNPSLAYNQTEINKVYEPKITTGGYGDRNFEDEWFWAASELLVTTGEQQYNESVKKYIQSVFTIPSWPNVYGLGCYTLVRHQKKIPSLLNAIQQIQRQIIQLGKSYLQNQATNAFVTVMGQSKRDFSWGGNSTAANLGIELVNAYLVTKDKKYVAGALSNLDYIVGRNATGYSFVTGFGSKPVMHPHHRPSIADNIKDPVPGLMVGGPNPGRQDGVHYQFTEPETAYIDVDAAYACNEIAINWNAPLVYLSGAIEALQYEVGYSKK